MTIEIYSLEEINQLIDSSLNFVFYFYDDNCSPCKSLRPKVVDLVENKFPKLKLFFVNSKINSEICSRFNVFSSPLILVFFEGKEYIRKNKMMSILELDNEIERLYKIYYE